MDTVTDTVTVMVFIPMSAGVWLVFGLVSGVWLVVFGLVSGVGRVSVVWLVVLVGLVLFG